MSHGTPAAGMNATTTASANNICIVSSGNVKSGIFDIDDLTGSVDCGNTGYATDYWNANTERVGVHGIEDVWGSALQTNFVSFAFKFTHPATAHLANNGTCSGYQGALAGANYGDCYGEHAIAVDIINFDQDNATKSHNAIYRMEAVETGDNTGIFTGTVAYVIMNNSTDQSVGTSGGDPGGSSGYTRGGHSGSPDYAGSGPGITPTVSGSDLSLLLGNGAETPRISYNDSDVTAAGNVIAAQLDTVDHSGTIAFDAISYGAGDTGTITITDLDLNQDSSVR